MKVKALRPRELIKIAQSYGWTHVRTTGSHWIMVKKGYRSVPIPNHAKELPPGFVKTILRQLGINPKEV
ncbi:MAG: hypothetical protein A2Z91_02260 [Deltaproteobacteria bacterium GWA2_38_16]|nr:MAG: hypothetical protein A2Z91_02260 [Deltaproteobacteria bacterium GWA2_38_16]OGQ02114.1 MAG: hypothetical protein A3D19_08555 [Deltaproteobacteria bacterium RIFCSPHIGHO2_02_FULL_38_15]OGQ30905.1 MAG: hypothetical protein A3A72_02050 [Deltaproteobacteria bacterium RIFCSPLOWO2_01_FULL_38_9]OGQ61082.1 MAG: hypothetical protein A3G92_02025 [Deltaproteobacteria bacterium RIFCSPLOWO2_12_FULL_38_8]